MSLFVCLFFLSLISVSVPQVLEAAAVAVAAAEIGLEICDRMKPPPPREYKIPPQLVQNQQVYDRPRHEPVRTCLNPDEEATFSNPEDCKELCHRPCLQEGQCRFCPPGFRKKFSAETVDENAYDYDHL